MTVQGKSLSVYVTSQDDDQNTGKDVCVLPADLLVAIA